LLRAHLCFLAILEKLRDLGFQVDVQDEGGFWESRDLGKLAEALRQYDSMVAGFTGAVRDAVERQGTTGHRPCSTHETGIFVVDRAGNSTVVFRM
jgi:hypothetical protein